MLLAELICSDPDCELVLESVGALEALDVLVCDECGCCLQVVSVSGHETVELRVRLDLALAA